MQTQRSERIDADLRAKKRAALTRPKLPEPHYSGPCRWRHGNPAPVQDGWTWPQVVVFALACAGFVACVYFLGWGP